MSLWDEETNGTVDLYMRDLGSITQIQFAKLLSVLPSATPAGNQ